MAFLVSVRGDKEIIRRLKKLEPKVAKKIVRKATRKVAKTIVLPRAKANMPVSTGALKRSLKVRAVKRSRKRIGHRVITGDDFFRGSEFYGGFVEYGYRVGSRRLGNARTLVPGQHPLGRAFNSARAKGRSVLKADILRGIEEQAKGK